MRCVSVWTFMCLTEMFKQHTTHQATRISNQATLKKNQINRQKLIVLNNAYNSKARRKRRQILFNPNMKNRKSFDSPFWHKDKTNQLPLNSHHSVLLQLAFVCFLFMNSTITTTQHTARLRSFFIAHSQVMLFLHWKEMSLQLEFKAESCEAVVKKASQTYVVDFSKLCYLKKKPIKNS